jgi:hypothetical protein
MTKIKNKKWPVITLLIAFVAVYNIMPVVNSVGAAVDSITAAKDLITDSDPGQIATHTITFTTGTSTAIGGYIDVVLDETTGAFGDILVGNITCPDAGADWAKTVELTANANDTARCEATALKASGTKTIILEDIQNPLTENEYTIDLYHYDSNDVLLERVTLYVAIIEDILMTARVESTLEFIISGVNSGTSVNGVNCDMTTTATTTDFGILDIDTEKTVCQRLQVATNADYGFSVTVEQDNELTSNTGSTINSFNNSNDGVGSSTLPHAWAPPGATIDEYHTYGHMGLTSQDDSLSWGGNNPFNSGLGAYYAGFNNTDPIEVMYHDGPVTNDINHKGSTYVAYTAEISVLQEAGEYQNTLTYICTPQY